MAEPVPERLAALKHAVAAALPVIFFCTNEIHWSEPKDFKAWSAGIAQGFHMKAKGKKLGLAIGQAGCLVLSAAAHMTLSCHEGSWLQTSAAGHAWATVAIGLHI